MRLAQINASSLEQLGVRLQAMIARINTVWAKEHQADGTHSVPRFRDVGPGELSASMFAALSGSWTVSLTNVLVFNYWKHGDAMFVNFQVPDSTVGGTPANLSIRIPAGMTAKSRARSYVDLYDNAAFTAGLAVVEANGTSINIYRQDRAPFTAGSVRVAGQLHFRTTA